MLKAIHQNIVLQKVEKTNSRGIFMPGLSNDIYLVLNIGEDVKSIKVNNKVVLEKDPKKIQLDLTDYYLTSEENVMAIVEEDHE